MFEHPPVQLYVVEECDPVTPAPAAVLKLALKHARLSVTGALDECFGFVTGVTAYDYWIERVRLAERGSAQTLAPAHARLAASVVEGARCGQRFFGKHVESVSADQREVVRTLATACREIAEAVTPSPNAAALASRLAAPKGCAELVEQLASARTALTRAVGVLAADSAT